MSLAGRACVLSGSEKLIIICTIVTPGNPGKESNLVLNAERHCLIDGHKIQQICTAFNRHFVTCQIFQCKLEYFQCKQYSLTGRHPVSLCKAGR